MHLVHSVLEGLKDRLGLKKVPTLGSVVVSEKAHHRTKAFFMLDLNNPETLIKILPGEFSFWCDKHRLNYLSIMDRRSKYPERDTKCYTYHYKKTSWICVNKNESNMIADW